MSLRYGIFCFLLFFIVALLAYKNYEIWSYPAATAPRKGATKKPEIKTEPLSARAKESSPRANFLSIAENNIFHPERKEFPITAITQPQPNVRPQITLYGVAIAGDYQSASIAQTGKPIPKGGRETMTIKIGDRLGDYKLTKIMPDRIQFTNGEDSFEVLLFDPKTPKKRMDVKTPSKPVGVTSSLPGPAGGPAPIPTPGLAPALRPAPAETIRPFPPLPFSPPAEPMRQPTIQPAAPLPGLIQPSPDPGLYRGRRSLRPGLPAAASSPGGGGNE
jgi:hypothetical protein